MDTPSISTYHYVELNQLNAVAGQETFERNIKDKKENEHDVYNRYIHIHIHIYYYLSINKSIKKNNFQN